MKRGVGMLLGKFYPPHRGHVYLCEFALAHVERLHIVVGSLQRETMPGALRHHLMQQLVPGASVSLTALVADGKGTVQRLSAGRNGFVLPY